MAEHISSPRFYVVIWLSLMVLTVVTVVAAQIDLGPFNTIVALTIASLKAVLVGLFFMHVKYAHERMIKPVIAAALFFLFLLLSLSMADYSTRLWS